ncbi:hypothetical protein GCM10023238_14630 [Streptomyces heliomycini]
MSLIGRPTVVSPSRFAVTFCWDSTPRTCRVFWSAIRYVTGSVHRGGTGRLSAARSTWSGSRASRSLKRVRQPFGRSGGSSWSRGTTSPWRRWEMASTTPSANASSRVRPMPSAASGVTRVRRPSSKANSFTRCMPRVRGRSTVR